MKSRIGNLLCAGAISTASLGATVTPYVYAGTDFADSKIQVGTGRVAITFNNGRRFFLTDNTLITERGEPVFVETLIQVGTGRRARFRVAGDVNDTITAGTLTAIEFGSQIEGPVTRSQPLTIFNYEVAVTAGTVLDDVPGDTIANLVAGDEVELSGFSDASGGFQATALGFRDEPLNEWVIVGPVTAISTEGFSIGSQAILFNGVDPDDCEGGLAVGRYVEVEATPDPSFGLGSTLTTTASIECESDELGGDPGAMVPAYIEGFVTALGDNGAFSVGEQTIAVNAETEYDEGDPSDVSVGVRVEVEGVLDTDTGILTATEVEFEQLRFDAEGPITPADVSGGGLRLFEIEMIATPLTEDDTSVLAGIAGPIQVAVEGFVDEEGNVYLDVIERLGAADSNDTGLSGGVESIDRPEFTILGVAIDTSTSEFVIDDELGEEIDADRFFSELAIGSEVEIEEGIYDEVGNRISGGTIAVELEDGEGDGGKSQRPMKGMNEFGVGIGVIVESGDAVFASGFE